MYREIIIDHYKNPRNFGTLRDADAEADMKNPLCGDEMKIFIKMDAHKKIREIKFTGAGCSVSRAGGSILTDLVRGKSINDLKKYTDKQFIDDMGVPVTPARKKCALLGLDTLRRALKIKKPLK